MSDIFQAIEEFRDAGLRVTPLHIIKQGRCGCESESEHWDGVACKAIGKHPMRPKWTGQLKIDDGAVALWRSTYAGHGMGWVLDDQHIVIDIDPRNGGNESLKQLQTDLKIDLFELCTAIVRTGGNGIHFYFEKDPILSLGCKMPEKYKGIDIKQVGGFVVMPGSFHVSGNYYEWHSLKKSNLESLATLPQCLTDLLVKERVISKEKAVESGLGDLDQIIDMLSVLSPNMGYDNWVHVGMAIHSSTNGSIKGESAWDKWSSNGSNYKAGECSSKWHGFGKHTGNHIKMGSLVLMAESAGWTSQVDPLAMTHEQLQEIKNNWKQKKTDRDSLPSILDTSDIDLYRPQGLLGEIYKYIYSCSPFDNKNLTIASALFSLGSIVGRKYYIKEFSNITPNMITFCVAGAATGKGPILSSTKTIIKMAGLGRARHGDLKSTKDLLDAVQANQYAIYIMDEFGATMRKLDGTADHFDGSAEKVMEVFTAGDSDFGLSYARSEELREKWGKEVATLKKALKDGHFDDRGFVEKKLARARVFLKMFDNTLPHPFFALFGVSTPGSMKSAYTLKSAESGFLSRAMVFHESETNPRPRLDFNPPRIFPMGLEMSIKAVAVPKDDCPYGRIDSYGHDRVSLSIEPSALELINRSRDYFYDVAEHQKDHGLESLPRRSVDNVIKVCLCMGAESGKVTLDIARYAIKLAIHELETKISRVISTEGVESHDSLERTEGMISKITEICDSKTGATIKHLFNRCGDKKIPNASIQILVDSLVKTGKITEDTTGKIVKYKSAGYGLH